MGSSANYSLPIGFVLRGQVYTYTIEKVLGQGSFGITYLASTVIQGPLGDVTVQVAIKEFFAKELDSRRSGGVVTARSEGGVAYKYAKAFQRESRNLSMVKHPGVVRVLEAFEANGTHYYSMEFLSGGSLDDKVKGVGMPEAEALQLVRKIGDALSYMHSRKIMHLDLKPKNIMLKGDGSPVIIDFGLSKQYDDEGEPESSSSIGQGTPGYAPLEQATQSAIREFQPTLDIYALGATLYKMLTGNTPPAATLILNKKVTLASNLLEKAVSLETVDAICKAMSPLVDDRPQSVKDFLSILERNREEVDGGAGEETEPNPAPLPYPAPARSPNPDSVSGLSRAGGKPKTWFWALLGSSVLATIVIVLLAGGGKHQPEDSVPADSVLVASVGDSSSVTTISGLSESPVAHAVTEPLPEQPGSIKITSDPAGAAIWLDGKNTKKKTPEILEEIAPGKHNYKLVLDGYKADNGSLTVYSGQRANVTCILKVVPNQEGPQKPVSSEEVDKGWADLNISDNPADSYLLLFWPTADRIISAEQYKKLNRYIDWLKEHSDAKILICGYCQDREIDVATQMSLAENGARRFYDIIVEHGIDASRLVMDWRGPVRGMSIEFYTAVFCTNILE